MRTLAAVLAVEGWAWPVPPLYAVMASAGGRGVDVAAVPVRDDRTPDRGAGSDLVRIGSADVGIGAMLQAGGTGDRDVDAVRRPWRGWCPEQPRVDAGGPGGGRGTGDSHGSEAV